jgi:putative ABC transport system substrate-binding protein
MQRRQFITLVGGTVIAWPLSAHAQRSVMPVVAFLQEVSLPEPDLTRRVTAFYQGMKETGYVDGQNVAIEYPTPYRSAEGQTNKLPLLMAELLHRQVAVIVGNTPTALAAKAATTTVPIVFVTGWDPVRDGLVASLNRPGGNLTGISFFTAELGAKQLELLRELRPGIARIAVLADPNFPTTERFVSDIRAAVSTIGQQIEVLYVSTGHEIETAFTTLVQRGAGALQAGPGTFMHSQAERIVVLSAQHRIPAIYLWQEVVAAGGLMSYAPSIPDAYHQAGIYVGRILKGEKPGDLPVMLPTKFELAINLKTAKALGLEIPPTLLAAADEVIE